MRPLILLAISLLGPMIAGCATDMPTATLTVDGPDGAHTLPLDFDPDARPAQSAYDEHGVDHPEFYSAHDLTVAWAEAMGRTVAIEFFDSSFGTGFFLAAIDGLPAEGEARFWQLLVNGTASDVGMHEVRVADGSHITWSLESF